MPYNNKNRGTRWLGANNWNNKVNLRSLNERLNVPSLSFLTANIQLIQGIYSGDFPRTRNEVTSWGCSVQRTLHFGDALCARAGSLLLRASLAVKMMMRHRYV